MSLQRTCAIDLPMSCLYEGHTSEDTPMPCLYGRHASEDMPTARHIFSRYETLGRSPKIFGGVGEVGPTQFFTSAPNRPKFVVY
ncbi:hypothetical protein PSHT_11789 [Puccinia striiformis]|uniref:Uncharacterized protein n=2 Tax=Puccinia striiformis TaxID=27350 RepID=A0A2S4UQK4_9BASI|nr:hypothetical protein PSTT_13688 [Puccinia striiformis]POW03253.1 hypothetical protein PSHT_11789 [Puccinia striiformis]